MDLSKPTSVTTSIQLSTRPGTQAESRRQDPSEPYRILLLGDFSGSGLTRSLRPAHLSHSGQEWRAWRIDIDNFEQVLQKLAPRLQVPVGEETTEITFTSLDDFHPDELFHRLPLFQQLRTWRRQLLQSDTFQQAADEVRSWAGQEGELETAREARQERGREKGRERGQKAEDVDATTDQDQPASQSDAQRDETIGADLLDQLLARPVAEHGRGEISPSKMPLPNRQLAESWESAIRKMVLPYCVEDVGPDRDALVAVVDQAAEELMRRLLHDRGFQCLESLWRGVDWFLREELDEDSPVQVHLADCSWTDLRCTLAAEQGEPISDDEPSGAEPSEGTSPESRERLAEDAARRLKKLLLADAESASGAGRWQLIVGLHDITPDPADVLALTRLGSWLERSRTPLISGASSAVLGRDTAEPPGQVDDWPAMDSESAKRWEAMRQDPAMRWMGLIWPRFLLRLPYGRRTQPCEHLQFEERSAGWRHENYLWGNSAFLWAAATAQEIARRASGDDSPELIEFGGMPVDVYSDDGEMVAHPCTETWVGEREVDRLLSVGVMPVLSVRGTDRVRLTSFRSLAGTDQFTL